MKPELTEKEFNQKALDQDPNPERALFWLSYYAEDVGNAYGRMKFADINRKTVRAQQYHKMTGSNTDKMMKAESSEEYRQACEDFQNACADYMRLSILKEAAVLKIGVWQSKMKLQNQGHPS